MWQAKVADLKHPLLKPVPIDLRNGLTPDAAAIVAVITNPGLRSQRARRSLASAQLLQAGLLPNPSLDFTLDPVTGGNTQGAVTAYNVGVSWELTALISHDAKVAAARAQSKSVELDIAWQEWQFAQAARKAVFDLVALDAQSTEAQAVDQRLGENLNLIRQAVEQRARTILDLAAAEAASQKAHADFLATQRDLHHQRLMLNQSLGLDPDATVRIASIMLPSKLDVPSIQELTSGAENNRLDLQALRLGYQSQEQTLRAAVLAQFPKIVLGVHQARDNTNVISTGFGVAIDLPIFDQNQGNIATQRATRQQLFDEYASRIFESRATIAQVIDDIHSLTEQIAAAEAAIPSLQRLVQTYEAAVGQHNADVLSYYLAWNDLSQKRIDLLKLKQQLIDNQMALEIASGRYLPTPIAPAPASGPTTRETLP
jgi:outer membrane protein TolC